MKTIILASGSPRRRELLEKTGLKFKVIESKFDEKVDVNLKLDPHELVKKLSLKKASVVFENHKDSIIISADTIVVCQEKILGKPKDEKDARKMLKFLSNKTHLIITGFTIINGRRIVTKSEETKVRMKKLSVKKINDYIATPEPFDKAGGYAIQEKGSIFVKKIIGDFSNAVGLPIYALVRELKKLGAKVI